MRYMEPMLLNFIAEMGLERRAPPDIDVDKALEVAKELIGDYANLLVKDHPKNVIEGKKINIDDYRRKIMDNKENNNNWVKRIFK